MTSKLPWRMLSAAAKAVWMDEIHASGVRMMKHRTSIYSNCLITNIINSVTDSTSMNQSDF